MKLERNLTTYCLAGVLLGAGVEAGTQLIDNFYIAPIRQEISDEMAKKDCPVYLPSLNIIGDLQNPSPRWAPTAEQDELCSPLLTKSLDSSNYDTKYLLNSFARMVLGEGSIVCGSAGLLPGLIYGLAGIPQRFRRKADQT